MKSIIELARVAGCHDNGKEFRFVEPRYLERFAALVREQALEEAAGARKHAAARRIGGEWMAMRFAAAIRALKEKQ